MRNGRKKTGAAFESTMAAPVATPDGYKYAGDFYTTECQFTSAEALGNEKKGRLGRLTWEFKTADVVNRNRRIYPAGVMALAIADLSGRVQKNTVFGNLDHPSVYDPDSLIVRFSEAAIKIAEVSMVNETGVKVVADILNNEYGRQLVSVIEAGGNPGVSQRALVRWREPNDAEIQQHQIANPAMVDVAESLRLITYDVVSEPGFSDADGASVTEGQQNSQGAVMDLTEFKSKHPDLAAKVIAEGKAAGVAEAKAAMEAENKAAIDTAVTEACKPLSEKIAAKEAELAKATEALTSLKPVLESLGIVNEKITDADAAKRIAEMTVQTEALKAEKEKLEKQVAESATKIAEQDKVTKQRAALEAASAAMKDHPAHNMVLERLAPMGHTDPAKAVEAARAEIAYIEQINPAMKGKATEQQSNETTDILSGLLRQNPSPTTAGSGNSQQANEGASLGAAIAGGISFGF